MYKNIVKLTQRKFQVIKPEFRVLGNIILWMLRIKFKFKFRVTNRNVHVISPNLDYKSKFQFKLETSSRINLRRYVEIRRT